MWSPKRNKNGARNRFYDNMRIVAPGDIVFSYVDTRIKAVGVIASIAHESAKPTEFGVVGANWDNVGWQVKVQYHEMQNLVRPRDHMTVLRSLLPDTYSPLTTEGNGLQGVYLAAIPRPMAETLAGLIGDEALNIVKGRTVGEHDNLDPLAGLDLREDWERHEEDKVEADANIPETERRAVVKARRGQGIFRSKLMEFERECRITHINNPEYLIASHIKPWRHSENDERIDGENGLLLCPNIDLLFDRGLISFEDRGEVIVSPVADRIVLPKMAVDIEEPINVGSFSSGQKHYLDYHREHILLRVG